MNLNELIEAMCFVFDVARKFYFVPGKVENWVILSELNHGGILDFPTKVTYDQNSSLIFFSKSSKSYFV